MHVVRLRSPLVLCPEFFWGEPSVTNSCCSTWKNSVIAMDFFIVDMPKSLAMRIKGVGSLCLRQYLPLPARCPLAMAIMNG